MSDWSEYQFQCDRVELHNKQYLHNLISYLLIDITDEIATIAIRVSSKS